MSAAFHDKLTFVSLLLVHVSPVTTPGLTSAASTLTLSAASVVPSSKTYGTVILIVLVLLFSLTSAILLLSSSIVPTIVLSPFAAFHKYPLKSPLVPIKVPDSL